MTGWSREAAHRRRGGADGGSRRAAHGGRAGRGRNFPTYSPRTAVDSHFDPVTAGRREGPLTGVSAGQGPFQHVVAGEGFEPSKLSRWIYRPAAASLWPAKMPIPQQLPCVFPTDSRPQPTATGHPSERSTFIGDAPQRQARRRRPGPSWLPAWSSTTQLELGRTGRKWGQPRVGLDRRWWCPPSRDAPNVSAMRSAISGWQRACRLPRCGSTSRPSPAVALGGGGRSVPEVTALQDNARRLRELIS